MEFIVQNKQTLLFSIQTLLQFESLLQIWFYDECYIRFSAEDYDIENIDNKFSHLTNNSVGKYSEQFYSQAKFQQNMMSMDDFAQYIQEQTGQDIFYEKILVKFKQQVIASLKCVSDMVGTRKNSFEHFGYDFLIDDEYNPWLIEINSSPSMEYSTVRIEITERLVKSCCDDIVKLIADYGLQTNKKSVGKWKCIYNNGKSYLQ